MNQSIQTTRAAMEFHAKAKAKGMSRAERRSYLKDLHRTLVGSTMPDMAKDYRAKRRAKRREAAKVKNLNRRKS